MHHHSSQECVAPVITQPADRRALYECTLGRIMGRWGLTVQRTKLLLTHSPLQAHFVWNGLRGIVEGSQLGDEVCGIQCSIHSQGLWNHQERTGKFSHSQLFSRSLQKQTKTPYSLAIKARHSQLMWRSFLDTWKVLFRLLLPLAPQCWTPRLASLHTEHRGSTAPSRPP